MSMGATAIASRFHRFSHPSDRSQSAAHRVNNVKLLLWHSSLT